MDISKIDKNFTIETKIEREDIVFLDCRDSRFEIRGVIAPTADGDCFLRMPKEVGDSVSGGVSGLNKCTAGGRIRLKTDSPYIAINVEIQSPCRMPHMPFSGSMGFDLYEKRDQHEVYVKSFFSGESSYEQVYDFPERKMRELTLNMPLYSGVKTLYIGLSKNAVLEKCSEYTIDKPMVYYGSSITQGGCASRPGNSYQAMISRRFNCDHINLGFSGNAKGEPQIAEYIAGLDMSLFVYDYDHNAPTSEHLKATHRPMFEVIREKNPELPIIIVSRPDIARKENADERFEIIKETYDAAISSGDKNVYLIDGRRIMDKIAEFDGTVDGCHPNDLGFYSMAKKIGDVIADILNK